MRNDPTARGGVDPVLQANTLATGKAYLPEPMPYPRPSTRPPKSVSIIQKAENEGAGFACVRGQIGERGDVAPAQHADLCKPGDACSARDALASDSGITLD